MNRNEIIADTLHKAGVAGSMQLADLIAEAIGQNENILAIRCMSHRDTPPLNANESTGAECPICAILEESENGQKRWEQMFYELFEEKVFHENHCTLVDENIALVEERDSLHVIIEEFWTAQAKDHHACGCDEWPECVHSLNAYELRSRAMNLIAARPSTISKSNSA
jgi:hypothetical protein